MSISRAPHGKATSFPLVEDVLTAVFRQCLEDLNLDQHWMQQDASQLVLKLSLVCRSWRHITLNVADLWRFHRVDCMRLQSDDLFARYRAFFASLLIRSHGRICGLCILNFPGPSGTVTHAPSLWAGMITAALAVCERFRFLAGNGSRIHQSTPCLLSAVASLATCPAPRLATAAIVVDPFPLIPHIRIAVNSLFNSPTAQGIRMLEIKGLYLRPNSLVCSRSNLTSIDFCYGSFQRDVKPLIAHHRLTLQSLSLANVMVDEDDLQLAAIPALTSLTLKGHSVALLPELHATSVVELRSLCLESATAHPAAGYLVTFLQQHPEMRVERLSLRIDADDLSPFAQPMSFLPHLRHLSIQGNIGPRFFKLLAILLTQSTLQVVELYDSPSFMEVVPSLLQFLRGKALYSGLPALASLHIHPAERFTIPCFVRYSDALALSQLVREFEISGNAARDVLGDFSHWMPVPFLQAVSSRMIAELLFYQLLLRITSQNFVAGALAHFPPVYTSYWKAFCRGELLANCSWWTLC
ncbi:hypothetical protein AURDEDRAFT_177889 [Auricularia subglabra TFB-10046 SS5]|uniref:F-box domain-containing protein n=1 Tax=Auricularia subglabra (strain TFB-10046 / SS5) TaxID=717982 RepID=J0CS04_AURST|nr:hypothetical protein AURDEDRAFT_177889 [Auricularia subglabra TFB-10046 SS5]